MINHIWIAVAFLLSFSGAVFALELNVKDFGAVGDGKTDDTAAFQKALDQAGNAGGGIVNVPTGSYRIDGTLVIPGSVTLLGTYRVPPLAGSAGPEGMRGSALLAYAGRGSENGDPFIRLAGNCATVAGLIISYPEWKQSDVPPVPYPPCIYSQYTENVGVIDCLLLNPYEGIKLHHSARHQIRNIHGYPIKRGIFVDECYDIGQIMNIHFWPFGVVYRHDEPYCKWINENGVAFEFARTDWQYVTNTFCFGYGIGYKFSEYKSGGANGNFLGIGADSTQRCLVVEQCQDAGLLITNGEFVGRWGSEDSVCIEILENAKGKVSLNNCSFWGPIDRCVWMKSHYGQFTAIGCNFVNWNASGKGSPAIQLDAGKAIIQGCTFGDGDTHISIGAKVRSAIISGNQTEEVFEVKNGAGKRAVIYGNSADPSALDSKALLNYRVLFGSDGDRKFVRHTHLKEKIDSHKKWKSFRWTMPNTILSLPVIPSKTYTVVVHIAVPKQALSQDAGLYYNGKLLVPIKNHGEQSLKAQLKSGKSNKLDFELRSKGWVPQEHDSTSSDNRLLGVALFAADVKAADAPAKAYIVNM